MSDIPFSSGDKEQRFYLAKPIKKYMEGKNFNNRWAAFKVEVDGHLRTALACAETVDVDLVEQAIGLEGVMVEMTKAGNWHSLQFCRASEWMDVTRFEAEQRMKVGAPAPEPPITKVQPTLDDTRDFRIHRLEANVEEVNRGVWKARMEQLRDRILIQMCADALGIKLETSKDHDAEGFTEEPFEDEDNEDQLDWLGQKPENDW